MSNPGPRSIATFGAKLLVALAIMESRGFAQTYEVRGTQSAIIYREGRPIASPSNEFQVRVDGCKVVIRTTALSPDTEYSEYGTQGEDSFFLTKFPGGERATLKTLQDGKIVEQQFKQPVEPRNDANLQLKPTLIPTPMADLVTPVWLAYGSRCYLSQRESSSIEAVFYQNANSPRTLQIPHWHWPKTPAEWTFDGNKPGLVRTLTVYFDGKALGFPEPFARNITNFVYQVMQWTNVGDLTIPIAFQITRYVPNFRKADAVELIVEADMHGVATNISTKLSDTRFAPLVTTKTRVSDYRHERLTKSMVPMVYIPEDGKIRELEALKATPQFQRSHFERKAGNAPDRERRKIYVYLALGALFSAPMAFLATRVWRGVRSKQ
jgi:hypothetical protein